MTHPAPAPSPRRSDDALLATRAVWKFSLPVEVNFKLAMPVGAQILHVETQYAGQPDEHPCLWALVDPDAPTAYRYFQLLGTGHRELVGELRHVGTYLLTGGSFVGHVFEVAEAEGTDPA